MLAGFELQQVRPGEWAALAGMLLVVAGLTWLALRRPGGWRVAGLAMAAFLLLRIALVGNPLSWHVYAKVLDSDLVGWRQYDLVRIQRDHYLLPPGSLRYLAVGSSQTEAVYGRYRQSNADLDVFVVAAMMPMDFVLYADEIARRQPRTVLLYLSDFDIAKEPSAAAMVVAPRQGANLPSVAARALSRAGGEVLHEAVVELVAGDLLPEFKFRFVFRGILDRYFRRLAGAVGEQERHREARATIEERIGWLRESLAEEHVAFNLAWLEDFLRIMEHRGIEVVMVEGHYHPAVTNAETVRLNAEVRERLASLAVQFDGVRFLPRTALEGFTADDYGDLTHVTPDAGERFTRRLLEAVDQPRTADSP